MKSIKILAPCGILGYGFPEDAFFRGIDQHPDAIIVDAGIGKPSQAMEAMEMGAAACLVNTAIASSKNPANMAKAFSMAVEAGRLAYLSKFGAVSKEANASSPLTGFLG